MASVGLEGSTTKAGQPLAHTKSECLSGTSAAVVAVDAPVTVDDDVRWPVLLLLSKLVTLSRVGLSTDEHFSSDCGCCCCCILLLRGRLAEADSAPEAERFLPPPARSSSSCFLSTSPSSHSSLCPGAFVLCCTVDGDGDDRQASERSCLLTSST